MFEEAEFTPEQEETLAAIAFVGDTLAPFFLEDPQKGKAGASFAAMGELDVVAAAQEWPFVDDAVAEEALSLMSRGVRETDGDDLMWEFRRLFVGPAAKAAPPWGSVYTDRECVVFGASTLELRQWMREQGIRQLDGEGGEEPSARAKEPEDHIGLMLALMAWVADAKPEALGEYLSKHLLTWAPHFLDIAIEAARLPFYEGLARLTKASLEGIRDELGLEVKIPRFYR